VKKPAGIAVLASGGGTNLQALLEHFNGETGRLARVKLVIASRPGIGALDRASAAGVSTAIVDPRLHSDGGGAELLRVMGEHEVDIVILAGYLHLVPGEVVERFRGRMLNVHPALLPAFGGAGMYGMRVHRAVLESGARVSGATVHQVDERYDEGAIVGQWPVPVLRGDTPESLAARVLRAEHLLLPAAVDAFLLNEVENPPLVEPIAFSLTSGMPTLESIVLLNR
jgi:phosphoribosylglycinamide formyltransferase 1